MTVVSFAPIGQAASLTWPNIQLNDAELLIGRSPESKLRLLHADIRFNHAALGQDSDGLYLRATAGAFLGPPSHPVPAARLRRAGDEVQLGPFTLTVAGVTESGDFTLAVALAEHSSADEAALARNYVQIFDVALPNVRLWALVLSCVIFAVFFVLPLIMLPRHTATMPGAGAARPAAAAASASGMVALWNVGTMSHAHAGFAADCSFCHQTAFVPVRSDACLGCHRDIGQHADPRRAPAADLRSQRCENCHHEHKGPAMATRDSQADCVACHGAIARIAPGTSIQDVDDFATAHPQFRPALVLDAGLQTTKRFVIGDAQAQDHGNLRFTHATHLKLAKLQPVGGAAACSQCHIPVTGGVTFKPVQFESACASCHTLQFEPLHPEWRLPHGHPEEVASRIAGYYAQAALAGEVFTRPQTDPFYKPGVPPPPPPPIGSDLVTYKTAEAMMSSIARSTCGECHVTIPPGANDAAAAWRVAPVFVPDRYMPSSLFSHAKHATTSCQTCHAAATSNLGAISLLPGIGVCRSCHAGEAGAPQRIASSCASCHRFHDGSMHLLTSMTAQPETNGRSEPARQKKELP